MLPPLRGHDEVRRTLAEAVLREDLPPSLLLQGAQGIGKQRLALWLAQDVLCERPAPDGPCGVCTGCRLSLRLEHPDLHWFFPLARPKGASSPEKLADALEDARAEGLEDRRAEPLRPGRSGEPVGIYLAQVQTLRRLALARPAMARRKVFVIGEAELMVPQESSPEAANAFLKVLEEPPADTYFILTSADPEALLATIRSRVLTIRLRPLAESLVRDFIVEARGLSSERATVVARLAEGSIGRALAFLPDGNQPGPLERVRAQAREYLLAAAADPPRRLALAHALPPAGSRGEYADVLAALGAWIRDLAAVAAGANDEVVNVDARGELAELARRFPAAAAADALALVDRARDLARGNVNPQLTTAWLLRSLGEVMSPSGPNGKDGGRAPGRRR